MLFNSFSFGFFLVITYILYWALFNKNLKARNWFLLAASYFFYGTWNWKLLFLIVLVSATDFWAGLAIDKEENPARRKVWLWCTLGINLGVLFFFKYFHFFVDSFVALLSFTGIHAASSSLQIILPVGISFYTFQGLGYVLDIYFKRFKPTRNPVAFFTFVAFFPQLIAGPIERAKDLLPQFSEPKKFDYDTARKGLLNIACGLFKKMVIADRLAVLVDAVYANPAQAAGWPAVLAVLFFTFQLYLDFSGYSQIALGTAQLFGFRLSVNFNKPYLSPSFKEFWKRWHITLTRWFGDYLYIPLGGNRKGKMRTYTNIMVVFAVSGLWHGASWNFVIWGVLNGLFLAVFDKGLHLNPQNRAGKFFSTLFVTACWGLSLVFFRAQGFSDALCMFGSLGFTNASAVFDFGLNRAELGYTFLLLAGLVLTECILNRQGEKAEEIFFKRPAVLRWTVYIALVALTLLTGIYGNANDNTFIYFQF